MAAAPALVLAAGSTRATPVLDRLGPARDAGFDGVSLSVPDYEALLAAGISAAEARARIADAGLFVSEVEIVGNWLPGAPAKPGMPAWMIALLARLTPDHVIAAAAAIGARGISVGEISGIACDVDEAAARFAGICDRAREEGLHVALEFIPTGTIPDLDRGSEVVRRAGRANGGLMVDSWHQFRSGSSLDRLAALPAEAIVSVQIGDAPALPEADLDREMTHTRLLPGEGALDLGGFVDAIARTGSQAPIAVEVLSVALDRLPIELIAQRCMAAVRQVMTGEGNA